MRRNSHELILRGKSLLTSFRQFFNFNKNYIPVILGVVSSISFCQVGVGQEIHWKVFPTLPDKEGFAGMFAG